MNHKLQKNPGVASNKRVVSVILCCYNSSQRIEQTLSHLAAQENTENLEWDVVLVDNNSSDGTPELARSIWTRLNNPVHLTIVHETMPGLANARRRGVLFSQSDYVVFCDDDNWLSPNYLKTAVDLLGSLPDVGAVGGVSQPAFAPRCSPPKWFDKAAADYAVGKQASATQDVTWRGYLWGAGIAFRRDTLRYVYTEGVTLQLLGRTGKKMSAGDDSELCLLVASAQYRLFYSELLNFTHYIPPDRLTRQYRALQVQGFRESALVLTFYRFWVTQVVHLSPARRILTTLALLARILKTSLRSPLKIREQCSVFHQIKLNVYCMQRYSSTQI